MLHRIATAAVMLSILAIGLTACEPEQIDEPDSGFAEDARGSGFYTVTGPWYRAFEQRKWHTMEARTRVRSSQEVLLIDVTLDGSGWVAPRLVTHDGWVIASCEGYAEDSPLVCLANATPRVRAEPPRAQIITRAVSPDRPTVVDFRVRFGGE